MPATVKISSRGTVTLPKALRKLFSLAPDDILIAEETERGILLRPASVYPTEIYTEERMQLFEAENNEAIRDAFPDRREEEVDE